ncbi:helix-turn-helix transcriptional regulator [Cupriavidus basilensis]|uniref:helix-turn-helix transcriptional regulator n=1 Tax=Cupriavidus basilensis TaxID=68895 RepID=UPI00157BA271|nr:helix-turn-helix transcriptional regulator [Cupriavidus basilensis]NUA25893.1 helix-turn-helix transcriptional regulator [Cupriavidus basilensis]
MPRLEKRDTHAPVTAAPKGIVDPLGTQRRIRLGRYLPSAALAPFIEHYWIVEWNLAGHPPQVQRVLPYPNANLVFDRGQTALFGVVRGVFDRTLEGAGHVLGVRFRVGGLRPLLDEPVCALTDTTRPARTLLSCDAHRAEMLVLDAGGDEAMVRAAEALLGGALPPPDPIVDQLQAIVAHAASAEGPASVESLAQHAGMGVRALQRLFQDYVGVSPKWVLRRYRLQEAAWRLARGEPVGLAQLAADLGYFDQAHLTRDFTRLVGVSPGDYQRSQQGPAGAR